MAIIRILMGSVFFLQEPNITVSIKKRISFFMLALFLNIQIDFFAEFLSSL